VACVEGAGSFGGVLIRLLVAGGDRQASGTDGEGGTDNPAP
jgi:hypothetical protein